MHPPAMAFGPGVARHALLRRTDAELDDLEQYRSELTGYCYRMLGSAFEAEDAVQETLIRAWRRIDGFEGRSSLRSWIYAIATNVCLDMLRSQQRRAMPMDVAAPSPATATLMTALPEPTWIEPVPDDRVLPRDGDPAEVAVARESIRLAFVTALQHLPPRQRAVLILRDVLRWRTDEVADLLGATAASVKSTLQRARATLAVVGASPADQRPHDPADDDLQKLLVRYVDAFERLDMVALVDLLHEDAIFTMPPNDLWLQGAATIAAWWTTGLGTACRGATFRPLAGANGSPALALYKPDDDGRRAAFAIQVVEVSGGRISSLHTFLRPELLPLFGQPAFLAGR